jgi:methyl-accepting chemotaxis protein
MNIKSLFRRRRFSVKRRRFLIKPAYQLKIALILVISILAYSIVLGFILFYPLFQELQSVVGIEERARVAATVIYLHTRLWPGVFIIAALVGVHVIIFSHRFFGPIYRFEQTLNGFLSGDFSQRIKLRRHDNLKEVQDVINRLAGYLEGTKSRDLEFRTAVKEQLKEVKAMLGPEENTMANGAYKIIHELITGLESDRDAFTSSRNIS